MKQLLQNLRTGETRVHEVPIPAVKPGTALIQTAASAISAGTERMVVEFAEKSLMGKARSRPDLVRQVIDKARREGLLTTTEAAFNRLDQPIPLGYSSAGTIISIGEGLQGFRIGQRVACAGGGYAVHAEYALVPQNLLSILPDNVEFEIAAFSTLGAIAMHGFRLSESMIGNRVAVIGLGLLGLLTTGIAIAGGCQVIGFDLDPGRVRLAQEMGAQAVLREAAVGAAEKFSLGKGMDAVLICADTTSNDPVELAGAISRDRAHVVAVGAVGLNIPRKVYFDKELTLINSRSYGPGRYDLEYEEKGHDYPIGYVRWTEGRNLEAFVELLHSKRLDLKPLITHRFPIDRAHEAYDLITSKRGETFLGILLTYQKQDLPQKGKLEKPERDDAKVGDLLTISEKTTVNIGVLGAGNFASAVMLPVLRKKPEIKLIGIASISGLNSQHAADKYGFDYATSDETQIINDPNINTIVVLTRHHLHSRQVVAALKAKKHVFCEKPLALNRDQISLIWDQLTNVSAFRILLTVGFNRRFSHHAQHMHSFLERSQEPLAAHYRVNAGYIPQNHWTHDLEQGGGRILGEACHFVDFLTFLVGTSPISVIAHALPDLGKYKNDNIQLTFTFPDGSLGTVTYLANGDKSFPKERVEVFKGGNVAVLNNFRTLELVSNGRRKVIRSRLRQDKGYQAEWDAFSNAILTGGPPPIPYEHILGVSHATISAVEALTTGEKIIIPS